MSWYACPARTNHSSPNVPQVPRRVEKVIPSGAGVSGGEARRLLLARTIHAGRELLIADEPTADLDPDTAAQIIQSLRALQAQGHTLLIATHDPALIAALDREVRL